MKVCILAEGGDVVWSYATGLVSCGLAATSYLHDGTQQRIIAALVDALEQARGQLGGGALQVADVVADVGAPPAKIKRHVPIAIAWNRDSSR